jgi:SAM-dependent methyltransferase
MEDYKARTVESYDKNALKFSEKFKRLSDVNRRAEFGRFIGLIPGKRMLDLGCGAGDHAKYFSGMGLDVTCVDISEQMVKLCKEKGLNALVMDIEDLKFKGNEFDGIWAVTSLLHIPKSKLPKVVDKLHEILAPNGILYVCVKKGDGEGMVKDEDSDSKRFFAFWKNEELSNLFRERFYALESGEVKFGQRVYLQLFFRKK